MLLTAALALLFAVSNLLLIVLAMLLTAALTLLFAVSNFDFTVSAMFFAAFVTVVFAASNFVFTVSAMFFAALVTAVFAASNFCFAVSAMLFAALVTAVFAASNFVFTVSAMFFAALVTAVFAASNFCFAVSAMLFAALVTAVFAASNFVFTVSAMFFAALDTAVFAASNFCFAVSATLLKTSAVFFFSASHCFFTVSHIFFAPALIESQFFTIRTPAATTPATTAPPIRNGAAAVASPPRVAVRPPPPATAATMPPPPEIAPTTEPKPDTIPPTAVITPPRAVTSGPTAAATRATLMIISFCPSFRPFHFSARSFTTLLTVESALSIAGAAVSTRSAPVSFRVFMMMSILSSGSRVSSNVLSTFPAYSVRDFPIASKEICPSLTAFAIAGPADFPNKSIAIFVASVSDPAPFMDFSTSERALLVGLPSLAAFVIAFFRPDITVLTSTPDFSTPASISMISPAESPISSKAAEFATMLSVSVPTSIPEACAALFSASSRSSASSTSRFSAAIAFCTPSIEEDTSLSFSCANLINFADSFSSFSPVTPKRVFTSPTAFAASPKLVGIVFAIFFAAVCISSRALPEAPVFLVTVSIASSTSFQAATDAAPTAAIGAVTFVVRLFPTLVTVFPTSCIFDPVTFSCWEATEPNSLYSPFRLLSCCSVSTISRSRAFCSSVTSSVVLPAFICFRASFSFCSFSSVFSIASVRYPCFCVSSSVLPGSSFRSLFTSFREACVFERLPSRPERAFVSFVVSPPISIVIPAIRFEAILSPTTYQNPPA